MELTLMSRFDALFVLDREVKHQVLPLEVEDVMAGSAEREVITFEVRPWRNKAGDAQRLMCRLHHDV